MKRLFVLYILLFAFVSAAFVEGHVVDTNGNALEGVDVKVYSLDNLLLAQNSTDANGYYYVGNVSGYVKIRAVKAGYSTYQSTELIPDTGKSGYDFMLVQDAIIHYDFSSLPRADDGFFVVRQGSSATYIAYGASGDLEVSPGSGYALKFVIPSDASYDIDFSKTLNPGDYEVVTYNNNPKSPALQLNSLDLTLDSTSADAGDEVKVKVEAHWNLQDYDGDVTNAVNWELNGVGELYLPRLIVTKSGDTEISVSLFGVSDSETIHVNPSAPVSLTVRPDRTCAETDESILLTAYLEDQFGNEWVTNDVSYTTNCGTISSSRIRSESECTAHITATYNPNTNLTYSFSVRFEESNSGSSGSSSGSSSSSGTTTTSSWASSYSDSSTSDEDNFPEPEPQVNVVEEEKEPSMARVIYPDRVYVGDEFTLVVVDDENEPLSSVVVVLHRPDNKTVSLPTDKKGTVKYTSYIPGNYTVEVSGYELKESVQFEVVEVKIPVKDNVVVVNTKPNKPKPVVLNTQTPESPRSMLDTIVAAFKGDVSLADALRATMPLWIFIAVILLLAALLFVAYSYMVGRELHSKSDSDKGVPLASGTVGVESKLDKRFVPPSTPESMPVPESATDFKNPETLNKVMSADIENESLKGDAVLLEDKTLSEKVAQTTESVSVVEDESVESPVNDELMDWMQKLKRKRSN